MDIESARLRQFSSSVQHHPPKKSMWQTQAESNRDILHDVTPPLNTLPPTNGTRSGFTSYGRATTVRWNPTRRNIYIRGHLLSHLDTRKVNSNSLGKGIVIHRPFVDGVRKEGFSERSIADDERNIDTDGRFNFSAVGRRHFMAQGQQLHNYKFIRGTPTQVSSLMMLSYRPIHRVLIGLLEATSSKTGVHAVPEVRQRATYEFSECIDNCIRSIVCWAVME